MGLTRANFCVVYSALFYDCFSSFRNFYLFFEQKMDFLKDRTHF